MNEIKLTKKQQERLDEAIDNSLVLSHEIHKFQLHLASIGDFCFEFFNYDNLIDELENVCIEDEVEKLNEYREDLKIQLNVFMRTLDWQICLLEQYFTELQHNSKKTTRRVKDKS